MMVTRVGMFTLFYLRGWAMILWIGAGAAIVALAAQSSPVAGARAFEVWVIVPVPIVVGSMWFATGVAIGVARASPELAAEDLETATEALTGAFIALIAAARLNDAKYPTGRFLRGIGNRAALVDAFADDLRIDIEPRSREIAMPSDAISEASFDEGRIADRSFGTRGARAWAVASNG